MTTLQPRQLANVLEASGTGATLTAVFHHGMDHVDKLPKALQPPPLFRDPGEFIVSQVENIAHVTLPRAVRRIGVELAHIGYGATWSALYGSTLPRQRAVSLGEATARGAVFGAVVGLVSYAGVLPAAGLTEPVHRQSKRALGNAVVSHAVWGVAVALLARALDRRLAR